MLNEQCQPPHSTAYLPPPLCQVLVAGTWPSKASAHAPSICSALVPGLLHAPLRTLCLSGSMLGAGGVRALSRLASDGCSQLCATLRDLRLHTVNNDTFEPHEQFNDCLADLLVQLPDLETLDIGHNWLGLHGVAAVSPALVRMAGLRHLGLSGSSLCAGAANILALVLYFNTSLRVRCQPAGREGRRGREGCRRGCGICELLKASGRSAVESCNPCNACLAYRRISVSEDCSPPFCNRCCCYVATQWRLVGGRR